MPNPRKLSLRLLLCAVFLTCAHVQALDSFTGTDFDSEYTVPVEVCAASSACA
jgi:hypothetical protein